MPTYGRIDIAFDYGNGSYLYTVDGEKYLDFATGIATNSLGHAHPHLVKKTARTGWKTLACLKSI
jgi:acetylornithine/N-succinyldiaminopimelate aminotransferase